MRFLIPEIVTSCKVAFTLIRVKATTAESDRPSDLRRHYYCDSSIHRRVDATLVAFMTLRGFSSEKVYATYRVHVRSLFMYFARCFYENKVFKYYFIIKKNIIKKQIDKCSTQNKYF